MTLIGYVVAVGITQTLVDLVIYHKPFVAITRFFGDYCNYFNYVFGLEFNIKIVGLFLLLILVPPMSVMLIFGFFRVFRKYILLVLPTLITLVYSIFILDDIEILLLTVPTYVIAGYVGWKEFHKNSAFWTKNKWLLLTCYGIFAVLDIAMMMFTFFA